MSIMDLWLPIVVAALVDDGEKPVGRIDLRVADWWSLRLAGGLTSMKKLPLGCAVLGLTLMIPAGWKGQGGISKD